jgi:predicted nucleic acid-binding protein
MPFVLDASIAISWHLEDEPSPFAERVLELLRDDEALVPSIWVLEVTNGLLIAHRRGRINLAGLVQAGELSARLPISVHEVPLDAAFGRVLDLARSQDLTVYDAAYLDLALREALPLATADTDLRAAAQRLDVSLVA